jgi:hypothetical protein
MNDENLDLPGELQDVASRLRENRNTGSPMELDEIKQRAMSRAARASRPRGRKSPRLVTAFLLAGLTLSGASAGVVASTSGSSGGQPSAAISQYVPPPDQIVAGVQVAPGNAKLLAPTGCVAKAFNARVSGQNVAKVVFFLDGKKIKTLTTPNSGARFQVRVNPANMKIGVHRITASVTFKAITKKAAQTFRISFQRCAKKLAAPRFTG